MRNRGWTSYGVATDLLCALALPILGAGCAGQESSWRRDPVPAERSSAPPPHPPDQAGASHTIPRESGSDEPRRAPKAPACTAPKIPVGTECCWQGQAQDPESGECRGVPDCPPELRPSQDRCALKVPPSALLTVPAGHITFQGMKRWVGSFMIEVAPVRVDQYVSQDPTHYGKEAVNAGCNMASKEDSAIANCVDQSQAERYCKSVGRRLPSALELSLALTYAEHQRGRRTTLAPERTLRWTDTMHRHCWQLPCEEEPMEGQTPRVLACGSPSGPDGEPCRALLPGNAGPTLAVQCVL